MHKAFAQTVSLVLAGLRSHPFLQISVVAVNRIVVGFGVSGGGYLRPRARAARKPWNNI